MGRGAEGQSRPATRVARGNQAGEDLVADEWVRDDYSISTDRSRLDLAVIHGYLSRSYWAAEIPLETVRRSIEHSLAFGVFHGDRQVGFARVITDGATFAYLGDVFVLEEYQGRGLGKWLMEVIMAHPDLQGLRRWMLATRDAHELYPQFGWTAVEKPESLMQILVPDIYRRSGPDRKSVV